MIRPLSFILLFLLFISPTHTILLLFVLIMVSSLSHSPLQSLVTRHDLFVVYICVDSDWELPSFDILGNPPPFWLTAALWPSRIFSSKRTPRIRFSLLHSVQTSAHQHVKKGLGSNRTRLNTDPSFIVLVAWDSHRSIARNHRSTSSGLYSVCRLVYFLHPALLRA